MADSICLETELRRLSELETVSPYVQARLKDAADAISELVQKIKEMKDAAPAQ